MLIFAASLFLLAANINDLSRAQDSSLQAVVGEEDELQVLDTDEIVLDETFLSELDVGSDFSEIEEE